MMPSRAPRGARLIGLHNNDRIPDVRGATPTGEMDPMSRRTIRDILQLRTLVKVRPETRVGEVARRMRDSYVGAVLVMDGDHLMGIFTERDVLDRVVAEGRSPDATEIQSVMTSGPIRVGLDMTTIDAARIMKERRLRHLPVEDNGTIVGIVSVRDFLMDDVSVYLM